MSESWKMKVVAPEESARHEKLVDDMVEETFPASDPPSFMGGTGHEGECINPHSKWLSAEEYNYPHFDADRVDYLRFDGPHIGETVPDFTLYDAEGKPHTLRDYRGQRVVLEIGSLSCPFFKDHIQKMDELASTFGAARFLVMYVRETYPGRYLPAINSFAQKWERAQRLQKEVGSHRDVVIDSVDGRGHQILGSMPNSIYIFEKDGTVGYRGAWACYETLQLALANLFDHRIPGGKENNCPDLPKLKTVWQTLNRSGWDAMWDVVKSGPELAKTYYRLQNMQHHHGSQHQWE